MWKSLVSVYKYEHMNGRMKNRKLLGSGVYLEAVVVVNPLVLCNLFREAPDELIDQTLTL